MRYSEIMKAAAETPEQKEWRLGIMYGAGASDGEWDDAEFEAAQLKNELSRSKVAQTDAATAAKLATLPARPEQADLDEVFPWPNPGSRSMTRDERIAVWLRSSLVAGRPLPLYLDPEDYGHGNDEDHPDDQR